MIEWGQVGYYLQSVCDKSVKIADLLPSIANLLPSTCTEIHIKQNLYCITFFSFFYCIVIIHSLLLILLYITLWLHACEKHSVNKFYWLTYNYLLTFIESSQNLIDLKYKLRNLLALYSNLIAKCYKHSATVIHHFFSSCKEFVILFLL